MEIFGWLGGIAFAVCAIPQAFQSWKDGHTQGLNWGFLGIWTVGEVCMTIYILPKGDLPLIINYLGNGICLGIMLWYKLFPRKVIKINWTPRVLERF